MYYTFIRSCTNWEEFSSAEKDIQETDLTEAEARAMCKEFNDNRSAEQIQNGTAMEFTSE